jgi:hypothetical protein
VRVELRGHNHPTMDDAFAKRGCVSPSASLALQFMVNWVQRL